MLELLWLEVLHTRIHTIYNFRLDRQHLRIFHPLSLTARSRMI
jgi:hypothetical protein